MRRSTGYPCILYRHNNGEFGWLVTFQADDSFGAGTKWFMLEEVLESKQFRTHGRHFLTEGTKKLNGSKLEEK